MLGLEAGVAQSVEQLIRNEKVEGSIPFSGTNQINDLGHLARVAFVVSGRLVGNLTKCSASVSHEEAPQRAVLSRMSPVCSQRHG